MCEAPREISVDYDTLWHAAFKQAFPGGRQEARLRRAKLIDALPNNSSRAAEVARLQQEVAFTRSWVHSICRIVRDLRNRITHHEPLISGFPLRGQRQRLTAIEGHNYVRLLARMLDRDLAAWLDGNSHVQAILQDRPA